MTTPYGTPSQNKAFQNGKSGKSVFGQNYSSVYDILSHGDGAGATKAPAENTSKGASTGASYAGYAGSAVKYRSKGRGNRIFWWSVFGFLVLLVGGIAVPEKKSSTPRVTYQVELNNNGATSHTVGSAGPANPGAPRVANQVAPNGHAIAITFDSSVAREIVFHPDTRQLALVIKNQNFPLYGIQAPPGSDKYLVGSEPFRSLQDDIVGFDSSIECLNMHGNSYLCYLIEGPAQHPFRYDINAIALRTGAATPTADAPEEYQEFARESAIKHSYRRTPWSGNQNPSDR